MCKSELTTGTLENGKKCHKDMGRINETNICAIKGMKINTKRENKTEGHPAL